MTSDLDKKICELVLKGDRNALFKELQKLSLDELSDLGERLQGNMLEIKTFKAHEKKGIASTVTWYDRNKPTQECIVFFALCTGNLKLFNKFTNYLEFHYRDHLNKDLFKDLSLIRTDSIKALEKRLINEELWDAVQSLCELGLIEAIDQEGYHLRLILQGRWGAYDLIKDNSDFLDRSVWRLFEIEGNSEQNYAAVEKYTRGEELTWRYAYKKLSQEDRLERQRLLTCSLEALLRDFMQHRAGWFSRFFDYLEPTAQEIAQRQIMLIDLLGSVIPPTVKFALEKLEILLSHSLLDVPLFLRNALYPLQSKSKSTVLLALKMLEKVESCSLTYEKQIRGLLIRTLEHPDGAVQGQVLKKLLQKKISNDGVSQILACTKSLQPSIRKKVEEKFGKNSPKKEISSIESTFSIKPLVKSLDPSRKIFYPQNLEELVSVIAASLENMEDLQGLESSLHGMNLYSIESDYDKRLVSSVVARSKSFVKSFEKYPWKSDDLKKMFYTWVIEWGEGRILPQEENPSKIMYEARSGIKYSFNYYFFQWFLENAEWINKKLKIERLSLPTHQGYWIDPDTVVQRSLSAQKKGVTFTVFDQFITLLRLACDNRDVALKGASEVQGEWGNVLRYSLGSDREKIGSTEMLWFAAARSRYPDQDDPVLGKYFKETPPASIQKGSIQWKTSMRRVELSDGNKYTQREIHKTVLPDWKYRKMDSYFFLAFAKLGEEEGCVRGSNWEMAQMLWPSNVEWIYSCGVCCMTNAIGPITGESLRSFSLFSRMMDECRPLEDSGLLLLNSGLSLPNADGRALAADAYCYGFHHKLFTPDQLGVSMKLMMKDLVICKRVRLSLEIISSKGTQFSRSLFEYLQSLLTGIMEDFPSDIAVLLEYFHELIIEHEVKKIEKDTIDFISSLPADSSSGKVAKKILKIINS